MKIISAYLNQELGLKCKFGEDTEAVVNFLRKRLREYPGEDNIDIRIANPTQLLALQLVSEALNWTLNVYDEDGRKFKDITAAHKYVNDEYITLDLIGLDLYTDLEGLE